MHKRYIEEQYRIARQDYNLAVDDNAKHDALAAMRRLMELAAVTYGTDYADSLQML